MEGPLIWVGSALLSEQPGARDFAVSISPAGRQKGMPCSTGFAKGYRSVFFHVKLQMHTLLTLLEVTLQWSGEGKWMSVHFWIIPVSDNLCTLESNHVFIYIFYLFDITTMYRTKTCNLYISALDRDICGKKNARSLCQIEASQKVSFLSGPKK